MSIGYTVSFDEEPSISLCFLSSHGKSFADPIMCPFLLIVVGFALMKLAHGHCLRVLICFWFSFRFFQLCNKDAIVVFFENRGVELGRWKSGRFSFSFMTNCFMNVFVSCSKLACASAGMMKDLGLGGNSIFRLLKTCLSLHVALDLKGSSMFFESFARANNVIGLVFGDKSRRCANHVSVDCDASLNKMMKAWCFSCTGGCN